MLVGREAQNGDILASWDGSKELCDPETLETSWVGVTCAMVQQAAVTKRVRAGARSAAETTVQRPALTQL